MLAFVDAFASFIVAILSSCYWDANSRPLFSSCRVQKVHPCRGVAFNLVSRLWKNKPANAGTSCVYRRWKKMTRSA